MKNYFSLSPEAPARSGALRNLKVKLMVSLPQEFLFKITQHGKRTIAVNRLQANSLEPIRRVHNKTLTIPRRIPLSHYFGALAHSAGYYRPFISSNQTPNFSDLIVLCDCVFAPN
jgi:hypothetical protein